jgi:ankyrin repeat protein
MKLLQGKIPPLYEASLKGNFEVIEYLLDHGADVNQPCDVSNCLHNNYPMPRWLTTAIQIRHFPFSHASPIQNISNININISSFMISIKIVVTTDR